MSDDSDRRDPESSLLFPTNSHGVGHARRDASRMGQRPVRRRRAAVGRVAAAGFRLVGRAPLAAAAGALEAARGPAEPAVRRAAAQQQKQVF